MNTQLPVTRSAAGARTLLSTFGFCTWLLVQSACSSNQINDGKSDENPSTAEGDGEVSERDASANQGMNEAGQPDAMAPEEPMDSGVDSGPPVPMDSGVDSGPPVPVDSGVDSGPPVPVDSGVDSGTLGCTASAVRCVSHERERCVSGKWAADATSCAQGCDELTAACLSDTSVLTHGIASGEVTSSSAAIWTRTADATSIEVLYGTEPNKLDQRAQGSTSADRDFTAQVELTKLSPGTPYYYRVYPASGARSEIGRFVTAPADRRDVTFVLSADVADVRSRFVHFDRMAEVGADAWISLGDFPYTDVDANNPATDLAGYRNVYRNLRNDQHLFDLFKSTSIYAIFDDHEVANNYDGAFRAANPERVTAGLRAWSEWFPFRPQVEKPVKAFYRNYRWGGVEVFILDTRSLRDARTKPEGPGKTMLSAAQNAWLREAMIDSTAEFKIIISTVPLDFGDANDDAWPGYRTERDTLIYDLDTAGIEGAVVISGDQHWFAMHHHGSGLKEMQIGPITAGLRTPSLQQPYEVVMRSQRHGYGVAKYSAASHELTLEAWNGAAAPGDPPIYREVIKAGRGELKVESTEPVPFQICPSNGQQASCAHAFKGTATKTITMAPPGEYEAQFGPLPGYSIANARGTLTAGGNLTLTPILVPRDEPLPWYDPLTNVSSFKIVDEGRIEGPSSWTVSNGALLQSSNIYDVLNDPAVPKLGTIATKGDPKWQDYTVSVWFQSQDDDGVGVLARFRDKNNYYRFSVDHQRRTARIVERVNGAFKLLAEVTNIDTYAVLHWTQLALSVKGDKLVGFINGSPVIEAQSSTLRNGAVGLYSWGSKGVRFDGLVVSAAETPQVPLPYSDDFSSDRGLVVVDQGVIDAPSNWVYAEGALVQASNIHDNASAALPQFGTLAFVGDPTWTDYEVSVSTRANDDDAQGLIVRLKDESNYYRFSVDQQRKIAKIVAVVGGEAVVLAQTPANAFSFDAKLPHRLSFAVAGTVLTGKVDGTAVLAADDDRLTRGAVGLYSWGMLGIGFDDLLVARP